MSTLSAFDKLMNQVKNNEPMVTDPAKAAGGIAKYTSSIPLADQMTVAKCSLRAQQYYERNVEKLEAELESEEQAELDRECYQALMSGSMNGKKVFYLNESNKKAIVRKIIEHKGAVRTMRYAWKAELTEGEFKRAFGAMCGRYELMAGTKRNQDGRLDFSTIRASHIEAAISDIQEAIDATAHRNGDNGDTCAEYVIEQDETCYLENLEPDIDDALKMEYAAIDKLMQKVKAKSA
tara:strand:+ start:22545 stop:23252 length:708 start_codon:yes stop_codon:yes gene_type:complete